MRQHERPCDHAGCDFLLHLAIKQPLAFITGLGMPRQETPRLAVLQSLVGPPMKSLHIAESLKEMTPLGFT
jgi:hypothetical protein